MQRLTTVGLRLKWQLPAGSASSVIRACSSSDSNSTLPVDEAKVHSTTDIQAAILKKDMVSLQELMDSRNKSHLSKSMGVFRESEKEDIHHLINNYTAPALARALRERESMLQTAAFLADSGNYSELAPLLVPFLKSNVEKRRIRRHSFDFAGGFTRRELVVIQRYLHRMPPQVFTAAERRASVVIPLCNVGGVASILFERRSNKVRMHKQQVCFPGGMVEEGVDANIIQTSLRETEEELGIPTENIEVLGILRCNWTEVASMTGVAVTPVVGFLGELNDLKLAANPDEVEQLFTVPMDSLLVESNWTRRDFSAPVFNGGPFVIWGLTAYLLDRLLKEIILKGNILKGKGNKVKLSSEGI